MTETLKDVRVKHCGVPSVARSDNRSPSRGRYGEHQPSLSAALRAKIGGAEGIRTPDPHNAIVVLYQLSYDPIRGGLECRVPPSIVKDNFPDKPLRCCASPRVAEGLTR